MTIPSFHQRRSQLASPKDPATLNYFRFLSTINDMPQHMSGNIAQFTDDTLFYASSISNDTAVHKLQAQIDLVQPWLHNWKITINPTKSTAILFTNKSTFYTKRIIIKDRPLEWASSIKYLGVTIDNKLTFSKHIQNTLHKANTVKFTLFLMINPFRIFSINTKLFIYRTYIRPSIIYAGSIWATNAYPTY